jgi:hypothetical protein
MMQKLEGFNKVVGNIAAGFYILKKATVDVVKGILNFVVGVSESNRELGKWNAKIATSFQSLDILRQNLAIQQGVDTQGSTAQLNKTLGELLTEIQPLVTGMSTALNLLAILVGTQFKMNVSIAKLNPTTIMILKMLTWIEEQLDKWNAHPDKMGAKALEDIRNMVPNAADQGTPRPNNAIVPRAPIGPLK